MRGHPVRARGDPRDHPRLPFGSSRTGAKAVAEVTMAVSELRRSWLTMPTKCSGTAPSSRLVPALLAVGDVDQDGDGSGHGARGNRARERRRAPGRDACRPCASIAPLDCGSPASRRSPAGSGGASSRSCAPSGIDFPTTSWRCQPKSSSARGSRSGRTRSWSMERNGQRRGLDQGLERPQGVPQPRLRVVPREQRPPRACDGAQKTLLVFSLNFQTVREERRSTPSNSSPNCKGKAAPARVLRIRPFDDGFPPGARGRRAGRIGRIWRELQAGRGADYELPVLTDEQGGESADSAPCTASSGKAPHRSIGERSFQGVEGALGR